MPIDGLSVAASAADVANAHLGAGAAFSGDAGAAGGQLLESSSNSLTLAEKKAASLENARKLRAAHRRHEYALRILRRMLRNSVVNKLYMVVGFAASLAIPETFFRATSPVFAAFGAHLGMEAAEGIERLRHARSPHRALVHELDPSKVLDKKIPPRQTVRQLVARAKDADKKNTFEITAAVLGAIYSLPVSQQIPIMGLYVVGMTAGVYGIPAILVKAEYMGQRLEAWDAQSTTGKFFAKTTIPSRVGVSLQKMTTRIFHTMPWVGNVAKFVTAGRVIEHAVPAFAEATEQAAHVVTRIPYLNSEAVNALVVGGGWAAIGVSAGYAAQKVVRPLMKTRLAGTWKKAAQDVGISLKGSVIASAGACKQAVSDPSITWREAGQHVGMAWTQTAHDSCRILRNATNASGTILQKIKRAVVFSLALRVRAENLTDHSMLSSRNFAERNGVQYPPKPAGLVVDKLIMPRTP